MRAGWPAHFQVQAKIYIYIYSTTRWETLVANRAARTGKLRSARESNFVKTNVLNGTLTVLRSVGVILEERERERKRREEVEKLRHLNVEHHRDKRASGD